MTFTFGLAVGAALAAAASWFYYTHAIAAKVAEGISDVRSSVVALESKVQNVAATTIQKV